MIRRTALDVTRADVLHTGACHANAEETTIRETDAEAPDLRLLICAQSRLTVELTEACEHDHARQQHHTTLQPTPFKYRAATQEPNPPDITHILNEEGKKCVQ